MELPLEMREVVASSLSYADILSLCRSDRAWREVCRDENFWRNLLLQRFPTAKLDENLSWKENYAQMERFMRRKFYITVSLCYSQPVPFQKNVYDNHGLNHASLVYDLDFEIVLPKVPISEQIYTNGKHCIVNYYPVLSKKEYFTEQDFLNFITEWLELLKHFANVPGYIRYGPEHYYQIY
nr:DNA-directed RNA polymerase subunit [Cedratvirus plubellavi]